MSFEGVDVIIAKETMWHNDMGCQGKGELTMKKVRLMPLILALFMCSVGCSKSAPVAEKKEEPREIRIRTVEVVSAVENEDHIYQVEYPYSYIAFNKEEKKNERIDMLGVKDRDKLTKEDTEYIMNYVKSIPENTNPDRENVSFRIWLVYLDENNEQQYLSAWGWDEFPEDWSEFIDYMNGLCGGEYLHSEGEVVEVTPQLLTELYGVTDEDVRGGTLEDFIEHNEYNMVDLTDHVLYMENELRNYYADMKETLIAPYRPYEIESVESTEEEYDAFMEDFFGRLGGEWEERESGQNYLRYYVNTENGDDFYIGKTIDLENMNLEPPADEDGYYGIALDAHMEGMVFGMDFFYSPDKKFIMVNLLGAGEEDSTDVVLEFVGVE